MREARGGRRRFGARFLKELGATIAWTSDNRGVLCTTLRDAEGNEFDVY